MKYLKRVAAAASMFALVSGTALAQDSNSVEPTHANDNRVTSFSCDAPDMSEMRVQQQLRHIFPGTVFIQTEREFTVEREGQEPRTFLRPGSLGSGFIVDSEQGYIITNHHVIKDAAKVSITFYEPGVRDSVGETIEATVIGFDDKTDVAVLQIDTDIDLSCVTFSDSDSVEVGDDVFAIGNPFGLSFTFTQGAISSVLRDIGNPYVDYLQTDAAINPGNSGGILFDKDGRIIGMNTAIYSSTGANVGLGLSIPSNIVVEIADEIIQHGEVVRGWFGANATDVTPTEAATLGLESAKGARIRSLEEGSPAGASGLRAGDVILEANGQDVEEAADIVRSIKDLDPNDVVSFRILRGQQEMHIYTTLGTEPAPAPIAADPSAITPEALKEFFDNLFRGIDDISQNMENRKISLQTAKLALKL